MEQRDNPLKRARPSEEEAPAMSTLQGVVIPDTDNTLRAGPRGPALMEDQLFREKIQHFDHERIPERVVHARGTAAHGYFECTNAAADITSASLFSEAGKRVPVFVRISTVQGSRGSNDLVRDVRGFAIKFKTETGNWDLVGNNIPVFFIQDAIKFPDVIHAVKPEPHHEMPQGATAHDTFWDFCSLTPETAHMLMWIMSDRTLPLSLETMEAFGVNTMKFVNAAGEARLVKFHFKPRAGVASMVWDEVVKGAGANPDFHRQLMFERFDAAGTFEWTMGVQVLPDEDTCLRRWGIDPLDATKIIPEECVPVRPLGRLVLNRNPDNFFAETEQVAFCPAHVIPGIEFSDDPLLQGRLFSYFDTQITRVGANFAQLPINAPVCPVMSLLRDGFMCPASQKGRVNYFPASLPNGPPGDPPAPVPAPHNPHAFRTNPQKVEGAKVRARSRSFQDHFSQATLFWRSLAPWERAHVVSAFTFELNQLKFPHVRSAIVHNILCRVDHTLAAAVAAGTGVVIDPARASAPVPPPPGAGEGTESGPPNPAEEPVTVSPALSMDRPMPTVQGRTAMIIVGDGADAAQLSAVRDACTRFSLAPLLITPSRAPVALAGSSSGGGSSGGGDPPCHGDVPVANANPAASHAVFVVAGAEGWTGTCRKIKQIISDHYDHGKTICDASAGASALAGAGLAGRADPATGVFTAENAPGAPGATPRAASDSESVDGSRGVIGAFITSATKVHRYYARQAETINGWVDPAPAQR